MLIIAENMLKLIADNQIPGVTDYFAPYASVIQLPGDVITRQHLQNADILLTRTITSVQSSLLTDTNVCFVGSVTTGTDHIDTEWLAKKQITLSTAAGANSRAVAEYVIGCIAALKKEGLMNTHRPVAGIVGCGRIGRIVATLLQFLGFEILCNDPLLIDKPNFTFVTLSELLASSDVITLHTPLTTTGLHPTYHLLNHARLQSIKPNAVLINTARGPVIDTAALQHNRHIIACLDVFEDEPHINADLLNQLFIGTPHIAGYSARAKIRATEMVYLDAAVQFGWPIHLSSDQQPIQQTISADHLTWEDIVLSIINPIVETKHLREKTFAHCRQHYSLRREFSECGVINTLENTREKLMLKALGFYFRPR